MPKRKQPTKSGGNYFYDVIPAINYLGQLPQRVVGAMTLKDVRPGQYIKLVDGEAEYARHNTLLVVSKPTRDREGDYIVLVVQDSHFRLAHPEREMGDFSQCCYQNLSLREAGIIPDQYGRWDNRYAVLLEDRSNLL